MSEDQYGKIPCTDISKGISPSILKNFIVSDKSFNVQDYFLDLRYPHIVEGISFAICVKGNARMKINLQEYHVTENMLITIMPGYIVELLSESDDLSIEFLFFTFDFIADLKLTMDMDIPEKIGQMPCLKITEEETQNLLEFHAFIVKQYKKTDNIYREKIAKSLLYTLICEVMQLYQGLKLIDNARTKSRQEELINQFVELLFKYHKQERSISFYAEKMFLTPKYLSKVIKDVTGKPVLQWIDEMVVMAAKALLKTSNMTILQISEELNFANASFFGSFFRKRVGMTPMQYREC
ncbi:AraC-like DNA-binding protein [Dysgonomonas alginatilytica]|uniref:AraC-like DNA-binding protein n=1 Tax=Dysgonomonas alginatilytica TaxID=1605892 RepID=A0A2V3PPL5_9BACT|nr:helix-turn-helix domain-containing protein [Dysgonomonas alginatilytica]PXV65052.1 AraC-like DNA-binding protein [Dysgonomonas alginatilytica]